MTMQVEAAQQMSDQEYRNSPGLSQSALKDLAVSPLRFWYKWIRPDRQPEPPTPEMQFGTALHCAVLEPDTFLDRYACEVSQDDYPGCLVTIDELRGWLRDKGITPKGTRKADVIAQVHAIDQNVPVLEVIERQHFSDNAGKTVIKKEDWTRIYGAAESLRSEPKVQELLRRGEKEVPMFGTDPDTGVRLKGRMDLVCSDLTLDIKTFSQKRGKSIDKSVTDALLYEGYIQQAVFYAILRSWPTSYGGDMLFAFVESTEPYEVRLRTVRPKTGSQPNTYWQLALLNIRGLIRKYSEHASHFGEKPWRYAAEADQLSDEELPGMIYAN